MAYARFSAAVWCVAVLAGVYRLGQCAGRKSIALGLLVSISSVVTCDRPIVARLSESSREHAIFRQLRL